VEHPGKKLLFMGANLGNERMESRASLDLHLLQQPLHRSLSIDGDLNRSCAMSALCTRFRPRGLSGSTRPLGKQSVLTICAAPNDELLLVVWQLPPVPRLYTASAYPRRLVREI